MKAILTLFLFITFLNNQDLSEVRKQFIAAATSKSVAEDLYNKLTNISNEGSKTLVAYKGAARAIMAKFASRQGDKMKYFKEGAKLLEYAIKSEPGNIEIRMIRLSIQENAPKITGYKHNINEDKDFILNNYHIQNNVLKEFLKGYIVQSKAFSESEKAKLFSN